jgi:hypothetical protein
MGLFSFLKKKPPIHDPFFGDLRYHVVNDCAWFEGQKWFAPLEKEVGLLVDADAAGPTETQRNFYFTLEHDYFELVDKIKPVLEEEFRNWKEDFVIQDFSKEFTLDHLRVPKQDITPLKWEMVFTSFHDLNHFFTIEFEGMEPKGIIIDG